MARSRFRKGRKVLQGKENKKQNKTTIISRKGKIKKETKKKEKEK